MHKIESALENEMHKVLWNFDIQKDHLIPTKRPDLVMVNKKKRTCLIMDFVVPRSHRLKSKENDKRDNYLDLARELKSCR